MNRATRTELRVAAPAWRILWALLMAAVAFAAIGLELDREVRRRPELYAIVPPPFRHFAQFEMTRQALAAGDNGPALAEAKRLVAGQPVPAENLSLLAMTAKLNGLEGLSNGAITLSAGRGWRELVAQGAVAEAAMSAGDWSAAFYRVVALWSLGERGKTTVDALHRIAAAPPGRIAIAGWLHDSRRWRNEYAVWGGEILAPDTHADTIALAVSRKTEFECPSLVRVAETLLRRGHPLASNKVWAEPCRRGSRLDARDFSFLPSQEGEANGPFGWISAGESIFTRDGGKSADGWRLNFENFMPGYTMIAHRYAGLKPGKYALSMIGERTKDGATLPLRLQMSCIDRDGGQSQVLAAKLDNAPVTFEIPESACASQHFQLSAGRGTGSIADVVLAATSS